MELDRILPPALLAQLPVAPSAVRAALERAAHEDATERMKGLDALAQTLYAGGSLTPDAAEAAPYVLAVATAPALKGGASLLLRLARAVAVLDDPPRALAGDAGTLEERRVYDRLEVDVPRLLRLASLGRDPSSARIAACLAARFPAYDAEVEPVLIALLSGADDEDERARLLYALTRVQASRGGALHRHVATALEASPTDPGRFAALLALSSHDPPEPLRARCVNALRLAIDDPPPDPQAFGRQLDPRRARVALARIEADPPS